MANFFSVVIVCDNFLYHWPSKGTNDRSSEIFHPPVIEGSPASEKVNIYKTEVHRLQEMVSGLGADPMARSLLGNINRHSKILAYSDGLGVESKSPLLRPTLAPYEYELDRMSAQTKQSSVMEMPLLKSTLTPNERDSDAVSAQTEYSRLTGDPEEGYGA
jgi:hypothetical protein